MFDNNFGKCGPFHQSIRIILYVYITNIFSISPEYATLPCERDN